MTLHRPTFIGGVIGVISAFCFISSQHTTRPATGPMLGEQGDSIRSLVMQYTSGSSFVWPVYRQFLSQQPPNVAIYLVCPESADFTEIHDAIGPTRCTIKPIFTHHPMTTWARDRWVELLPPTANDPPTLLAPKGELEQDIWPQRAGDSRIVDDLAKSLQPPVSARHSSLYFDGGDFLCDAQTVFITPAVLNRNLQHTIISRQGLIELLQHDLHRKIVIMDDAPDHHAGMYMMAAGETRMIVGDPLLGEKLLDTSSADFDDGPDFTAATQHHFDAIAKLTADLGYRVYRIPTAPAHNGKMFMTYVNVIMDNRAGRPIVYMPIYDGQPRMNAAAQGVWESLGYEVHPINCSTLWQRGGTLHCLVNVLKRGPANS